MNRHDIFHHYDNGLSLVLGRQGLHEVQQLHSGSDDTHAVLRTVDGTFAVLFTESNPVPAHIKLLHDNRLTHVAVAAPAFDGSFVSWMREVFWYTKVSLVIYRSYATPRRNPDHPELEAYCWSNHAVIPPRALEGRQ